MLFRMDGVDVGHGELIEDELVKVSDADIGDPEGYHGSSGG
jgi:hypothetical protein